MCTEHEHHYGLGMVAMLTTCIWNTGLIPILAWMKGLPGYFFFRPGFIFFLSWGFGCLLALLALVDATREGKNNLIQRVQISENAGREKKIIKNI